MTKYFTPVLLFLIAPAFATAQDAATADQKPEYFNQKVADANPLRTEQARELDEDVKTTAADASRHKQLF